MKKLSLLVAALIALSLSACSQKETPAPAPAPAAAPAPAPAADAKPAGAATTNAQAIAAACPLKYDVVVITCADDAQIGVTAAYVDSASVGYTPDGEAVMDLTVIEYPATFAVAT